MYGYGQQAPMQPGYGQQPGYPQQPNYAQQPGYAQHPAAQPGYFPQMGAAQLTPDQEQRFAMIDVDRSGTISAEEIARLYQFQFPADCALALIHAINGMSQITRADFSAFDAWMMRFNQVFMQFQQNNMIPSQVLPQALQVIGLTFPAQHLQSIQSKFAPRAQVLNFGQFVSVASYVLLCGRIMQKFDSQRKGSVTIDYNGMVALGLWFV